MNTGEYVNPPNFLTIKAIFPWHSPLETILVPSLRKLVSTHTNFAFLFLSPVFYIFFSSD